MYYLLIEAMKARTFVIVRELRRYEVSGVFINSSFK